MLVLTGKNLRERQQQLNIKVNEAARNNVNFQEVKCQTEKSDVDKLFKIDLAAKYQNIEYILEILKYGDSLYISRALDKCTWLYDKDSNHIVNSDYLSDNVFPFMSIKMRNKLLTAVASHLKNNDPKASSFYTYCIKMKLYNIALKFLIHTTEINKLNEILKKTKAFKMIKDKEGNYLKHFIGESFVLAENYIKNLDCNSMKNNAIYSLKYMYYISDEKYLNLLETCCDNVNVLGRRLSKHIIQSHRSRVMKKPLLYANILNKNIIARNSSVDDAKIFAIALLPENSSQFFTERFYGNNNYYTKNKFVLDLIPAEEKFTYIKKIFTEKYPGQAFESSYEFYSNGLYNMMTADERETWALQNIDSHNELLGSGKDYLWYKFVNFEKALTELKEQISKTMENNKRCEMFKILIDSAKNEVELCQLLNYYGNRHRNEAAYITAQFLDKLISDHKVWQLGVDCWIALEKIFYILKAFDKLRYADCVSDYRVLALMYYVLNGKPVLDILTEFLDIDAICFYTLKKYLKKSEPESEIMIHYITQHMAKKIEVLSSTPYENETKQKIKQYIRSTLDLLQCYDKTKDYLPEIMHTYIKLDWAEYKNHTLLANYDKLSSKDIMHCLKKDARLVVNQFPKIKDYIESSGGNINWLILKLKIYFSHDLSKQFLTLFYNCLTAELLHYGIADVAVRGIITLADWNSKIEFLEKYAPKGKKIDLAKMPLNTFNIQRAICRQMHCSQPPLPLRNIFQFVIGDYVQYCLILFRWYLLNLPYLKCLEFVESMIDKPVSIQKHGLRLAFECFDEEKLTKIILDSWSKTKNVSLRAILYRSLFMKLLNENGNVQPELFEALITLTLDLNEDDDEAFHLCFTDLPDNLIGRYLEAVWKSVSKFSNKPKNVTRMAIVINNIECSICSFPEDCLNKIVENHVHHMLDEGQIFNQTYKQNFNNLVKSKWDLTITSLVYMVNKKKLAKNLELVQHILKQCNKMWNERSESDNSYVIRRFFKNFIVDLCSKKTDYDEENYCNIITILQAIEQDLKEQLPEKEVYILLWYLRSSIITKKVMLESNLRMELQEEQMSEELKRFGTLLGSKFGSLIKSSVEEGTFYRIFYEQMEDIVSVMINNLRSCVKSAVLPNSSDILVLFCLGLLEHQIPETYMFASKLLPIDYEDIIFIADFVTALEKVQHFENTELKCYVYEKFVNTDFKQRNYIL